MLQTRLDLAHFLVDADLDPVHFFTQPCILTGGEGDLLECIDSAAKTLVLIGGGGLDQLAKAKELDSIGCGGLGQLEVGALEITQPCVLCGCGGLDGSKACLPRLQGQRGCANPPGRDVGVPRREPRCRSCPPCPHALLPRRVARLENVQRPQRSAPQPRRGLGSVLVPGDRWGTLGHAGRAHVIASRCGTRSLLGTSPTPARTTRGWRRQRFRTDLVDADAQSSVRGSAAEPTPRLLVLPAALLCLRAHSSPRRDGESWRGCRCSGAGLLALTGGIW
mmetsp:Transcript_47819/g.113830  ORF Transcript_47819/g.113830 Transcript_47819/m.113830 type:complete len:278 (-) Transcript_47819:170-1003(-)